MLTAFEIYSKKFQSNQVLRKLVKLASSQNVNISDISTFQGIQEFTSWVLFSLFFEELPPLLFKITVGDFAHALWSPKGNRMPGGLLFFFLIVGTTLCYNKVKNSLGDNNGAKYVILANSEGEPIPR